MTADLVRWGILGTGSIAATFAEDLAAGRSGRVVAVGSRRPGSAELFADRFRVPNRHGSYESLVADPEVDVVYVATPHPRHRDDAVLALEAGKPVLLEKPFALDAREAREVVAAARARGLFLMEAMWTRFLPHVAEIRSVLASGALGEIVSVSADHGQRFPDDPSSWLLSPDYGGGALLDLGIYPVSFASMLLGPPSQVVAVSDPTATGVDAQTSILLRHPGGAHAVLTCTLRAKSPTRAAIVGILGRIEVDGDFYTPTGFDVVTVDGGRRRVERAHEGRGLRHEADEVARCLREGLPESPLMPLDESVSIMATMDEVRAQAALGNEA
ncbi:MAG: Gfo/Idh/MocA family oxidoreductase [Actinomycetota bacterium]|nr:Gfo/Idh/MocA family oxidoreductase [Actinomycetota bacterium]